MDVDTVLDSLNFIKERGAMIYVWPNGQIEGIIPSWGFEKYTDEKYGLKRERFTYYDLDGDEKVAPRDGVNDKTMKPVDLLKIEHTGGVAVTEFNGEGRTRIITGRRAENLIAKEEDDEALERELKRLGEEYRKKDRNYRDLMTKLNNVKEERKELEEDIEEFRTANERLNKENERLRAINMATESFSRQLENELRAMGERHEDILDEVKNAIRRAKETKKAKVEGNEGEIKADLKGKTEEAPKLEEEGEESEE